MEKQKLIDDIIQIVLKNADNVNESIIDYKLDKLLTNKALTIPVVIDTLVCDITKGTRCKDSFPNYRDGVCYVCGGQAN